MKTKTLVAMAALALLVGVPARAQQVVSSNTVGYNKVTLTSGYNLLGANWKLVGGTNGTIDDVMDSSQLEAMDVTTLAFNAEMMVWNGTGYDTYGWSGEVGDDELDNKWLDPVNEYAPVAVPAPAGAAFWVNAKAGGTVVFSGEVASSDTTTVDLVSGYNLVANPYPETISVQAIQSTDLSPMDVTTLAFNAEMMVWNGTGYDTYGWSGEVGDDELDNKWLDPVNEYAPSTATLDIGTGCWIRSNKAAHVTFTK